MENSLPPAGPTVEPLDPHQLGAQVIADAQAVEANRAANEEAHTQQLKSEHQAQMRQEAQELAAKWRSILAQRAAIADAKQDARENAPIQQPGSPAASPLLQATRRAVPVPGRAAIKHEPDL